MASLRLLILLLLLHLHLHPHLSPLVSVSARKVSLSVYYEALCPYCSDFIVNRLPKLFSSGLISAVDLDLVPYGNARLDASGSIVCQHGQKECLLNTVEACAINARPIVQQHFSFIYCVERTVKDGQYANWEACFQQTGFDSNAVVDCYNNGYGVEIELQYKAQTDALQPPHLYVPWVTVNGQPIYEDYENFEHYICKAIDGVRPRACEGLFLTTFENEKPKEEEPFCLVEGMISSYRARKKHKLELQN
ncbi:gamma-interferon-inducible lysosomal thiol reductase [Canna indica]|uniref:Gamma-interferon-inducible lysosomal thiol reductase n=1 Tax=Canna indica TaxID=4628 RepID=A0AAQ3QRE1_9LILI|nr:gamma-interferon-inducible lysosomal thiol reductase [Canna indica]